MRTPAAFLPPLAALSIAAFAFAPGPASAQSRGCGAPLSSAPVEHAGETPVFTGVDHDDRAFTLTQDPKTGAWALWVISNFTEQSDGVAIGTPCLVVAGAQSKVLAGPASEMVTVQSGQPAAEATDIADAGKVADAPADAGTETYRVASVDRGDVLDLRSGAGTDFPSLVRMPRDATGISVGSCKSVDGYRFPWCEVAWQGTQGWASACCLEGERTGRRLD